MIDEIKLTDETKDALAALTDGEVFRALLELCPPQSSITYTKELNGVGSIAFTVSRCTDCVTKADLGQAIHKSLSNER